MATPMAMRHFQAGLSASAFPGTLMGFSITNNAGAAEGYAIWIDWNHNNTFEASEEVYASPGTIAPGALATGTFTVPAGAVLGILTYVSAAVSILSGLP